MNVGDVIHNGIWVTEDTPKWQKADYKRRVQESIKDLAKDLGAVIGPFKTIEMRHDHWEIAKYLKNPKVPDHIRGPNVKAMIVSAEIVSILAVTAESSFVTELDSKDLLKLRKMTKEAAAKNGFIITDEQADQVIEELGPDAALENLRTVH